MKKPNLQRLAQRSKIYLRKASPTILSGLGAAGVIVTSVLAVRQRYSVSSVPMC